MCYQKTNEILRKRLLESSGGSKNGSGRKSEKKNLSHNRGKEEEEEALVDSDGLRLDEVDDDVLNSFDIKDTLSDLGHALTEQDALIGSIGRLAN